MGSGRVESVACVPRPAVFQGAGRNPIWPALAQRAVREQPGARPVPNLHQRRRKNCRQKLQGHQEAGSGGVQTTEKEDLVLTERPGRAMSRRERKSERWQALGVAPQRKVREEELTAA